MFKRLSIGLLLALVSFSALAVDTKENPPNKYVELVEKSKSKKKPPKFSSKASAALINLFGNAPTAEKVAQLLEQNADPNVCDNANNPAIFLALWAAKHELVAVIAQHEFFNANAVCRKVDNNTVLHAAVAASPVHLETVDLLIAVKADPNQAGTAKVPPFFALCEKWKLFNSDTEIFRSLMAAKGDPNFENDNGENVLHKLSSRNQDATLAVISVAIEAKVDPYLPNKKGATPLFLAVEGNQRDVVKAMLSQPWKSHQRAGEKHARVPLLQAAAQEHWELVRMLAGAGADPEVIQDGGTHDGCNFYGIIEKRLPPFLLELHLLIFDKQAESGRQEYDV